MVAAAESAAAAAACGVDGCAGVRAAEPGSEPATDADADVGAEWSLSGSAGGRCAVAAGTSARRRSDPIAASIRGAACV